MPFDLGLAARTVRLRHPGVLGFRQTLLDLLFAAGCNVREQAVALAWGDAVCIRTAGPAAPIDAPPLVLVAVDLDPPGCTRPVLGEPATWPAPLRTLGGPEVAIGWLAALRALLHSNRQRPWELVFVRGPAFGLADFLGSLLPGLPPGADVVQLVPTLEPGTAADLPPELDLVRLDLVRPRNIWRFPACDHAYAVEATATDGRVLPRLREVLGGPDAGLSWTLHDLAIQPGPEARLSAVLRASRPLTAPPDGLHLREIEGDQRLLFPINDALLGLLQVTGGVPGPLGQALQSPLQAESLPDGLCVHAVVPALGELDLPDRAGALSVTWHDAPLVRAPVPNQVGLAVAADDLRGPVPAGLERATALWRLPPLVADDDLQPLHRALAHAVA